MIKKYNHKAVEKKWQKYWEDNKIWQADEKAPGEKFYILDMFPYPSAEGLHVGHPEGYTASDIVARYQRMKGKKVLHPMGFDSFGLPAENYAIKTGTHPAKTTAKNIKNMRKQIKSLGFAYDWDREVITSDPSYYKWTQWIFIQLFKKGLAYEAEAPINWCPSCKTGLANEEVVNGKCERCSTEVTKKFIKQWLVKITDEKYIERLLNDLDREDLDWPESIKQLQRNWIGRSEGAEVDFSVIASDSETISSNNNKDAEITTSSSTSRNDIIKVFTTRPDTLFGATYMVLSPEHELVDQITTKAQHQKVHDYQKKAASKSDLERTDLAKDKTGVFTGAYAINPVNKEKIPVWIADYVLSSYGTGAIMAVPAHDERDHEFAKKFKLPIVEVVKKIATSSSTPRNDNAWTGEGIAINSGEYDGLKTGEFKKKLTTWLEQNKVGKKAVNYKLRDWLFSRQRYWGEPIPIVHCESCKKEKKKTILIIHGTGGNGRKNWNGWLADKLRLLGHEVIAPDLPNPNQPIFEEWMKELEKYSSKLDKNSVVIGHSLGGYTALQFVAKLKTKINKLILVAPTSNKIDWKQYTKDHPNDPTKEQEIFHHQDVEFGKVEKNTEEIIYYYADNDFYLSPAIPDNYKKVLKANYRLLKGRNHFSIKNGGAYIFPELFTEVVGENSSPVGQVAVSEEDLPVELPDIKKYEPTGTGESPLASIDEWVNTSCPECGGKAKRETNTMPQWAGSNWYFLRYCDPHNDKMLADPEKLKAWLPVDLYIGGAEHAVLHLLYARFIYKFLFDIGVVPKEIGDEPFKKLKNQGLIMGEDGVKMSKSRGNVINPDDVIEEYGADTLRMYEMFMGPFEDSKPWDTKGIVGIKRFLDRVWELCMHKGLEVKSENGGAEISKKIEIELHKAIKKVSGDIENFRFNTAISELMIVSKIAWSDKAMFSDKRKEILLKLLSPFAPHMCEELWEILGHKESISKEEWPEYDASKIIEKEVTYVVQVNGKVRDNIRAAIDASEDNIKDLSLKSEKVKKYLTSEPKKVIFVPGKLINFVI